MSSATPEEQPADVSAWLTLAELADRIGEAEPKVRRLVREGKLDAVTRDGVLVVPAGYVVGGELVKGLGGLSTLLHDAGYDVEESIRWMTTVDTSLGASPLAAMAEGRTKEVNRLAQTLGF